MNTDFQSAINSKKTKVLRYLITQFLCTSPQAAGDKYF